MYDYKYPLNSLDVNYVLFNKDLLERLYFSSNKTKYKRSNEINLNEDGLYLVNFNNLNKKNTDNYTLIYRYINYDTIFTECLINYIEQYQKQNVKHLFSDNTIFVIDKYFENKKK